MRIAFISDIHGNAVALEAVLEDIQNQKVDRIAVLGDICFRGPEPKRALQLVRELKTDVVKGNADEWIVRGVAKGEVPENAYELMNRERDWGFAQLSEEEIDYLASLPKELHIHAKDEITIHAFHATPESLFDVVLPFAADDEIKNKLMVKDGANLYVYGHIHKAYSRYIEGKTVLNIGSVGMPFDGYPKASYGIVGVEGTNISVEIRKVAYDVEKVACLYEEKNYPNTEMMSKIIKTGSQ